MSHFCTPTVGAKYFLYFSNLFSRRGGVEVERSPRMREIGVRSPVATDMSRKNR